MRHLRELLEEIEHAVVRAAQQVQESNLDIFERYFTRVGPGDQHVSATMARVLESDDPSGVYTPKTVTIEYPVMLPKDVPIPEDKRIHRVVVPLISLIPPQTYYIDDMRIELHVEVEIDSEGEASFLLVSPSKTGSAAPDGEKHQRARVEVTVKRGERPAAMLEIMQGYDRALRAEIPG